MKRCWLCFLKIASGLLLLAGLLITSGVLPFTASSGHLPITAWALEFAMERSVSTHSLGTVVPPLDDQALILRGAGHYEQGCAWCHGRPGQTPGRIPMHMTPHAPDLAEEVNKWQASELFYIVGHGVKFTAMPGWPDDRRRDEAWSVVAFLQTYPQTSSTDYDRLSGRSEIQLARDRADESVPEIVITRCIACHGLDGQGRGAFPKLAGQSARYLADSIEAYQAAARNSGIMGPAVEWLSDSEIQQAAKYYADLSSSLRKPTVPITSTGTARISLGREIAQQGLVKQKVGACVQCHGDPGGQSVSPDYPVLAGQRADYLLQQLHLFRQKVRGGTSRQRIMTDMAELLTDEQIEAVANYYASPHEAE